MSRASDIVETSVDENPARMSEGGSVSSLRSWTVRRLMTELSRRGISYPASARKAELYRLLVVNSGPQQQEEVPMVTVQNSLTQIHLMLNERREELDLFLFRITELGYMYGGSSFYDYHCSFSAKAAATLSQFQFLTNWANIDTEIFVGISPGLRHLRAPCAIQLTILLCGVIRLF